MTRILKFLRKRDWIIMAFILGLVFASVYLDLKIPDFMADITTYLESGTDNLSNILITGAKMLGCALGSAAVSFLMGYLSSYIAANLSKNLRQELYDHVEKMSVRDIEGFSTASLITRATNDITQIQNFFAMGLAVLLKAPVLAVWALIKIFNRGTTGWVIATGTAVGITVLAVSLIISYALPRFRIVQKQIDDVNLLARENIDGVRVIKAFNAENKRTDKFEKANTELTKTNTAIGLATAAMSPLMSGLMSGLSLAIYWIGAYAIEEAAMADKITLFSNMIVFSSYAMQVVMAFMLLIVIFMIYPRASVSAHRICEIIFSPISLKEGTLSGPNSQDQFGHLEFRNVSFSYEKDGKNVIENASFDVKKGKTLAIIGATGSGKTTLVNLAARFYDPNSGEVLIDGVNAKDYRFEALYNRIAIVPQTAAMFSGTIEDNVRLGTSKGGNPEDLKMAIETSQAAEFVERKTGKTQSVIEQGGRNLSGGQKQRLAIARALARKPEIIIFDDSFSALDYQTDLALRIGLAKNYPTTTKIIIAQRVGTIKDADEIIVLENGKIVGKGRHSDLLVNCPTYHDIALSQLSKEELAHA